MSYTASVAPPKRKSGGRVTPKKAHGGGLPQTSDSGAWRVADRGAAKPAAQAPSGARSKPAASSRYTPPSKPVRVRSRWHRPAGWIGIVLGVLIAVVNDLMLVNDNTFLPFGHSEAYLFLGLFIAGGSTWFLGLFDRGTTIYR